MLSSQERISNVSGFVSSCSGCACIKDVISPVMGDGNANASVVFVGRAPGREENVIGKPFVGASGRQLDKLLSYVQLRRSDVYITNLVKCYPPDDRDNTEEEIENCFQYLVAELLAISPKLVVVFGKQPVKKLLNIDDLMGESGHLFETKACLFFPMIHPASVLKDQSGRALKIWNRSQEVLKNVVDSLRLSSLQEEF